LNLFDSNILIYDEQPENNFLLKLMFKDVKTSFIFSISVVETLGFVGISLKEKRFFELCFSKLNIIDISTEIIYKAVELKQIKKMCVADSIVAATSINNKCVLYSRNTKDFAHIKKLNIINPFLK